MTSPRLVALRELAEEAVLERRDFIVEATEQIRRFLEANRERFREIGQITLVDDEQDFLRYHPVDQLWVTRLTYQDPADGEWYDQEQEVDNLSELVELYNPADIMQWLIEASRNPLDHLAPADELATEEAPPAEAEDDWQNELPADQRETLAAQRLWQLADAYRSQLQEQQAALLREFVGNAEDALRLTGDLVLLDEQDDTLVLRGDGRFETTLNLADMPPRPVETIEAHRQGLTVTDAKTVAEFYDPADVLQWVTESLNERYPAVDFSRRLRLTRAGSQTDAPRRSGSPGHAQQPRPRTCSCGAGALREGHFRLKSGLHSPRYLEKFLVFQYPTLASELCRRMAVEVARLATERGGGAHHRRRAAGVRDGASPVGHPGLGGARPVRRADGAGRRAASCGAGSRSAAPTRSCSWTTS